MGPWFPSKGSFTGEIETRPYHKSFMSAYMLGIFWASMWSRTSLKGPLTLFKKHVASGA